MAVKVQELEAVMESRGTAENMPSTAQSGTGTAQSDTAQSDTAQSDGRGVHIVHTPLLDCVSVMSLEIGDSSVSGHR